MTRFLIEVPHEAERAACARVVEVFLSPQGRIYLSEDRSGTIQVRLDLRLGRLISQVGYFRVEHPGRNR